MGNRAGLWVVMGWGLGVGDSPAGLDALPGGGELDQDPLLAHAGLLVQGDQLAGAGHHFVLVERQPGGKGRGYNKEGGNLHKPRRNFQIDHEPC